MHYTKFITKAMQSQEKFKCRSNSNYGFHLAGPRGLFLKAATEILPQLVERPRGLVHWLRAGRKGVSCNGVCPLGLSCDEYQGYTAVQ
ncbi:MAG: hypothetical protein ABIN18_28595 [Pseudomonadota bacterium]